MKTTATMRPYVADLEFRFDMFASQATFLGGATFLGLRGTQHSICP